jgi:uncharacterized membrane protein
MRKILWIISIIIWIIFISRIKRKKEQDNINKKKIQEILSKSDESDPQLDKFYISWYLLTIFTYSIEWFWLFFIIYGINLLID